MSPSNSETESNVASARWYQTEVWRLLLLTVCTGVVLFGVLWGRTRNVLPTWLLSAAGVVPTVGLWLLVLAKSTKISESASDGLARVLQGILRRVLQSGAVTVVVSVVMLALGCYIVYNVAAATRVTLRCTPKTDARVVVLEPIQSPAGCNSSFFMSPGKKVRATAIEPGYAMKTYDLSLSGSDVGGESDCVLRLEPLEWTVGAFDLDDKVVLNHAYARVQVEYSISISAPADAIDSAKFTFDLPADGHSIVDRVAPFGCVVTRVDGRVSVNLSEAPNCKEVRGDSYVVTIQLGTEVSRGGSDESARRRLRCMACASFVTDTVRTNAVRRDPSSCGSCDTGPR